MLACSAGLSSSTGAFPCLRVFAGPTSLSRSKSFACLFSSTNVSHSKLRLGDRVLLSYRQGKTAKRKLTQPLREDGETVVDNHRIQHRDIIGQPSYLKLASISKDGLRKLNLVAHHPDLDDFTSLAPRHVAPVYASYASTIVSFLDIHVEPPSPDNDPQQVGPSLQILEAGTGQGSLTLQLARAISSANPPIPSEAKPQPKQHTTYRAGEEVDGFVEPTEEILFRWQKQRRAVVHTVDNVEVHRHKAEGLIRSYRNAMYWPHINFYHGEVQDWVHERMSNDPKPFLDIVVLDMPGVEDQISVVADAIKEGGQLVVFAPQITQIAACIQGVVSQRLGLKLEQVVELGEGISTGRMWDIRMATLKKPKQVDIANEKRQDVHEEDHVPETVKDVHTIPPMVCRPKVGSMIRGGGFIGLWRRVERGAVE